MLCVHGAAATYTIFQPSGAVLIEVYPFQMLADSINEDPLAKLQEGLNMHAPKVGNNIYGELAKDMGNWHLRLLSQPVSEHSQVSDFRKYDVAIDPELVLRTVKIVHRLLLSNCTFPVIPLRELMRDVGKPCADVGFRGRM